MSESFEQDHMPEGPKPALMPTYTDAIGYEIAAATIKANGSPHYMDDCRVPACGGILKRDLHPATFEPTGRLTCSMCEWSCSGMPHERYRPTYTRVKLTDAERACWNEIRVELGADPCFNMSSCGGMLVASINRDASECSDCGCLFTGLDILQNRVDPLAQEPLCEYDATKLPTNWK